MRKFIIVIALAGLAGCSWFPGVHKIDIPQGNVVTEEMMSQLRPGMTRSQVRFVLGTPLLVDSFHQSRWDYVYRLEQEGALKEQGRLTLWFNGDVLERIEDEYPAKRPR